MPNPYKFFTKDELFSLELAIKEAEKETSGEIILHIDSKCTNDPIERAKQIFAEKKLHKTKLRNAVLFYLAVDSRKFAIWADEGINQKVEDNFWNEIASEMTKDFKNSNFVQGLETAIRTSGEALKAYFPYEGQGSLNELSDEIGLN